MPKEPMEPVLICFPREMHQEGAELARENGLTFSAYVRLALARMIDLDRIKPGRGRSD
jgi:hypothetical protein